MPVTDERSSPPSDEQRSDPHDSSDGETADADATSDENDADATDDADEFTIADFHDASQHEGRPVLTAAAVSRALEMPHEEANEHLEELAERGGLERHAVSTDPVVWYPTELEDLTDRERVIVFPKQREIIVDRPDQFTRAQLSQFAHLADGNGEQGYRYVVRPEDVWGTPHDSFEDLARTMRQALGQRAEKLEDWVESQWDRAHQFRLATHEDGYTVLEAQSPEIMGNVARQKLDEEHVHAPISETEDWVQEGSEAAIKRILYEAGYPVQDHRELESGEELPIDLEVRLRDYQRTWVDHFAEAGEGVFVGPPGSGKTVAAMGAMAHVDGETLVLVPSRDLAQQWADTIVEYTSLEPHQIGQYHGGRKEVRPVTIATYQIAGMDRHRSLFDDREWGSLFSTNVSTSPRTSTGAARISSPNTDSGSLPVPFGKMTARRRFSPSSGRRSAPTGRRCSTQATSPNPNSRSVTCRGATMNKRMPTARPTARRSTGSPRATGARSTKFGTCCRPTPTRRHSSSSTT